MKFLELLKDTKSEFSRITWPSNKETLITAGVVVTAAVIFSLVFTLFDAVIFKTVKFILSIGDK
jgi:preprotein translocase subunit SecE